jgi:hypothetical protein
MKVSTEDLVAVLRMIAKDLQSPDGVANVFIDGAANRMTLLANLAAKHVEEMEAANQRIKRLEDWKQSQLEVDREWDANALATMLGAKLGESHRKVIQREVPRLLDRIKRLEEAGDAVEERLGCGCGCGGPCRACQSESENWFKAKEAKP